MIVSRGSAESLCSKVMAMMTLDDASSRAEAPAAGAVPRLLPAASQLLAGLGLCSLLHVTLLWCHPAKLAFGVLACRGGAGGAGISPSAALLAAAVCLLG